MGKKRQQKTGTKRLPPKKKGPFKDSVPEVTPERVQALMRAPRVGPKGKSKVLPPQDEIDNNQFLRFSAGLYYTTDLNGPSMAQMAKHPVFGKVTIDTLYYWSTQDRWVERRRVNIDNWRRTMENKIGNELVKMRTDMLSDLRTVFDKSLKKLTSGKLKARSYEGMVTALVRLAELMDSWNDKLFHAAIPDMPVVSAVGSSAPMESKPRLSKEEAHKAASAILEMRRNEMRAALAKKVAAEVVSDGQEDAKTEDSDG